jgi:hypothetical protein
MSLSAQLILEQLKEFIENDETTDQDAREVQADVNGEEVLDPDNTMSVLCTFFNTINNHFEHKSLDEAVRLLNTLTICQYTGNDVSGHKCSIPGLSGTNLRAYQV